MNSCQKDSASSPKSRHGGMCSGCDLSAAQCTCSLEASFSRPKGSSLRPSSPDCTFGRKCRCNFLAQCFCDDSDASWGAETEAETEAKELDENRGSAAGPHPKRSLSNSASAATPAQQQNTKQRPLKKRRPNPDQPSPGPSEGAAQADDEKADDGSHGPSHSGGGGDEEERAPGGGSRAAEDAGLSPRPACRDCRRTEEGVCFVCSGDPGGRDDVIPDHVPLEELDVIERTGSGSKEDPHVFW